MTMNRAGKRRMNNYLFLSRVPEANIAYSAKSAAARPPKPLPSLMYRMADFLTNNKLAWLLHNWRIKKRFDYPTQAPRSVHVLRNSRGGDAEIRLVLAADWASGTPQAAFVGEKIGELLPDYTIHMGDTYYSGTAPELADNFGDGDADPTGIWPRGAVGSYVLAGNHEMFSSGKDFLAMINNGHRQFGERILPGPDCTGQELPFFCLLADRWAVIGLDTGYDCLQTKWYKRLFNSEPNNVDMVLPGLLLQWLGANPEILRPGRAIVLLSHHQYATAFADEEEFTNPARQLKDLLGGREVIWIWGHEHRFALYNRYQLSPGHIACHGRCIGNGGMVDEHLKERMLIRDKALSRGLEVMDYRVADTFHFDNAAVDVGYNDYAQLDIEGDTLRITYWAAYWNGNDNMKKYNEPIITETWRADGTTGSPVRVRIDDLTINPINRASGLSWAPY